VSYTRMTGEERSLIYWWKQAEKGVREIATLLRRAPSSVSREVRRNTGQRGYRPKQA
jgi:transposase, IS30 family